LLALQAYVYALLSHHFTLKTEAAWFSRSLADNNTWNYNPEDLK
jgi:hypothetical protein